MQSFLQVLSRTFTTKADFMNKSLELFLSFAKIGAFTIGGGYAMIPIIQEEVVNKKKWLEKEEFLDVLAIAQSAPGLLAVNISIFVGYRMNKTTGSIIATLGSVLPSFVIILAIAMLFRDYAQNPAVNAIFKGIRPVVVALIAVPAVNMIKSYNLGLKSIALTITVIALVAIAGIQPTYILLVCCIASVINSVMKTRKKK